MSETDICYMGAKPLARLLRARKLSATEVLRSFIARIEKVNPKINAIVTFLPEEALKKAKALDRSHAPRARSWPRECVRPASRPR